MRMHSYESQDAFSRYLVVFHGWQASPNRKISKVIKPFVKKDNSHQVKKMRDLTCHAERSEASPTK